MRNTPLIPLFNGSTGTSEYMSPTTVNGQPTGIEGDLWALGVVFFQCITGTVCAVDRGGEGGCGVVCCVVLPVHLSYCMCCRQGRRDGRGSNGNE
jgi:hypothetical protein